MAVPGFSLQTHQTSDGIYAVLNVLTPYGRYDSRSRSAPTAEEAIQLVCEREPFRGQAPLPPARGLTAVLHAGVSTKDQAEGYSVAAQRKLFRESRTLTIPREFILSDDRSPHAASS
jgi:hypothetical protein